MHKHERLIDELHGRISPLESLPPLMVKTDDDELIGLASIVESLVRQSMQGVSETMKKVERDLGGRIVQREDSPYFRIEPFEGGAK